MVDGKAILKARATQSMYGSVPIILQQGRVIWRGLSTITEMYPAGLKLTF